MPKDTDFAYAAGIVDGEGAISINFKKIDNRCQLILKVVTSEPNIPNWLSHTFGGRVLQQMQDTNLSKNYISYSWSKYGKSAQYILTELLPYLQEKKIHALISLELPIKEVGERLSDTERNKQRELAIDISRYQKKGGKAYVPEVVRRC